MCGSRKFCQRGSNFVVFFFFFFLVDEGREDPSTTISGPSSARQRNAVSLACDDGPTLNAALVAAIFQGNRTCIARKPSWYFCDFSGGRGIRARSPPLWICTCYNRSESRKLQFEYRIHTMHYFCSHTSNARLKTKNMKKMTTKSCKNNNNLIRADLMKWAKTYLIALRL